MATFKDIFKDIRDSINPTSKKMVTPEWIAGMFKRSFEIGRIENALKNHGSELKPDILEEYQNIIKLKDIAVNNNLLKNINGNYKVTDRGSKFIQELSAKFKEWDSLNDLSFKELRREVQSAKGQADQEWYDSLSPIDQHIIDLYSQMTLKEFHFLTGIKNDKDSKQKYVNRVETLEDSDPESYNMLRSMGFITPKNTINDVLVTKFFNTLSKFDYRHLRSFNRSISSKTDRIAADRALNKNFADTLDHELNTDDGSTMSKQQQMTANVRMPSDVEEPNNRQKQRSKILTGRKDEFNKRFRKTKPANESKSLSFKKFLVESLDK